MEKPKEKSIKRNKSPKNCIEFINGVQAEYKKSLDHGRIYFYDMIKWFVYYSCIKFGYHIRVNLTYMCTIDLEHYVFMRLDETFSKDNFGIMFTRGFYAVKEWLKKNKVPFMSLPISERKISTTDLKDKFLSVSDIEDKLSVDDTAEIGSCNFIKEVITNSLHKLDKNQLAVINGLYFNGKKRKDIYSALAGKLHKSEREIHMIEEEAYESILTFIKDDDN